MTLAACAVAAAEEEVAGRGSVVGDLVVDAVVAPAEDAEVGVVGRAAV